MRKLVIICLLLFGCDKEKFLDIKQDLAITVPVTLQDFERLLENTVVLNKTGSLAQLNADEYYVTPADWQVALGDTQRNSYIWAADLYGGDEVIASWNDLYAGVFYANNVLQGLQKEGLADTDRGRYLKGWAMFVRAYAYFDLARNFCEAYPVSDAVSKLGLPIRLEAGIDYVVQRSDLESTYQHIIGDLLIAEGLLPANRPEGKLNRPSKLAVHALLSRIYLDMGDYPKAEIHADKSLNIYNKLLDYRTINVTVALPFNLNNDEIIYHSVQVVEHPWTNTANASASRVAPGLISLYELNDLRLPAFYTRLTDGAYKKKSNYYGSGLYSFTGLATDEVHLIKAECLARRGQLGPAMDYLNYLSIRRWNPNASVPAKLYEPKIASDIQSAVDLVVRERRKELAWRGTRWFDLKRLNRDGAGLVISRSLGTATYTLQPNDKRYVMPIPNDEIILSGIKQNPR